MTSDESSKNNPRLLFAGKALFSSYGLALLAGWIAGELLKLAGYTYTIEARIVGGGESTIVHPIAGEWYGGMLAIPVLLLSFSYWFWYRSPPEVEASG